MQRPRIAVTDFFHMTWTACLLVEPRTSVSGIFIIVNACGLEWTTEHQKQKSKTWLERVKDSRLQSPEIRCQENGFSPKSVSKKWNFSYALMLALWDSVQTSALRKRKRICLWLKSLHLWQFYQKGQTGNWYRKWVIDWWCYVLSNSCALHDSILAHLWKSEKWLR